MPIMKIMTIIIKKSITYTILSIVIFLYSSNLSAKTSDDFPYKLSAPYDIMLGGTALSLLGISEYFRERKSLPSRSEVNDLDKKDINAFDRSATNNYSKDASRVSDILLYTSILSPVLIYTASLEGSEYWLIMLMYCEAFFINLGLTLTVKAIVSRERPYMYNDSISIDKKMENRENSVRSFYSGHTSRAFCAAMFLSKVYSDLHPKSNCRYLVWGLSFSVAITTGYLRYAAGKHFLTDILAGAITGSLIGYFVPELHKRGRYSNISLNPIINEMKGASVSLFF